MSLYNTLFGMNSQTDILLAVIGLKRVDVQRFRNVWSNEAHTEIEVYTRTGGGNREDYPNSVMRHLPTWITSVDDDFDSTYCTDKFRIPAEWVADVVALDEPFKFGIRAKFARHLAKTINRKPTESDIAQRQHDEELQAIQSLKHFMANGHTFVPMDDQAMEKVLGLAEANGGGLRSCWGIMPLALTVKQNFMRYPSAHGNRGTEITRVDVGYDFNWKIDHEYWQHCVERFSSDYPITMAKISEQVERHTSG